MKICSALLSCSAVIFNSIALSSQSQPPAEPSDRSRSRSPTLRETFPGVLGFRFEDLEFIRLRPYNSPNRVFELRKYTFPSNRTIGLRIKRAVLHPMPSGEQIVLSTSDGDVFAILHKKSTRITVLRGIFKPVLKQLERAKINIISGVVELLTAEEILECPVSTQGAVANYYAVFRVYNEVLHTGSSSQSESFANVDTNPGVRHSGPPSLCPPTSSPMFPPPAESPHHDELKLFSLRQNFPNVLGYRFEELGSIRLTPHNHPHRIFELRIYVFPPEIQIGLRTINHVFNPMPTGDQIVLSTSDGDVYAVLLKSSSNHAILRPIFTNILGVFERVKMNMNSGTLKALTAEENSECPVIFKGAIKTCYKVFRV